MNKNTAVVLWAILAAAAMLFQFVAACGLLMWAVGEFRINWSHWLLIQGTVIVVCAVLRATWTPEQS